MHPNTVETDAGNFDRDFGRGDLGSEDAEQYRKMKAPDVKPEAFPNN